jgi:hypothetical protein
MITVGKIPAGPAIRDLEKFAQASGRTMLDELRTTAKALAVQLAYQTKPKGKSKSSIDGSVKSIDKNLNRLFASPGSIHQALLKTDAPAAAEFWHAHKNNKKSLQEKIIRRTGIPIRFDQPTGTSAHQREIPQKHFVRSAAAKNRYRKAVLARLGRAKAGWAAAAVALTGNHRGIPAWAGTGKHSDAAGSATVREDPIRPLIRIKNNTAHIRQILTQGEIDEAIAKAYQNMHKRMLIQLRKQRR